MKEIKTEINVIEIKRLGEFHYGETAIVSICLTKDTEEYFEYYKEEVMEYFNISSLDEVFSLNHFSNDAVCNMPIDLYNVNVNILFLNYHPMNEVDF